MFIKEGLSFHFCLLRLYFSNVCCSVVNFIVVISFRLHFCSQMNLFHFRLSWQCALRTAREQFAWCKMSYLGTCEWWSISTVKVFTQILIVAKLLLSAYHISAQTVSNEVACFSDWCCLATFIKVAWHCFSIDNSKNNESLKI